MQENERKEEGELRRWVSNLQLESWQLELLITGFSIFLLATSLEQYDAFQANFIYNKLSAGAQNPIFTVSLRAIITTIPLALRFFLISLLVHLLLRGFWIGIVGLSSVSNKIEFDSLNLKKPFKNYIPKNVQSLDELIFFLDKVSSVIFAYTYLIAFSIISVVIVGAFLFSILGLAIQMPGAFGDSFILPILSLLLIVAWVILLIGAVIFFLDTLLFSSFKKSKWFSILYYPIYRFYTILSISFLYRSIYYHLITNFKKKYIILTTILLLGIVFLVNRVDKMNVHTFFPDMNHALSSTVQNRHYDDLRGDYYITAASIPSKYVEGRYLELFIRYNPDINQALKLICPEAENMELDNSLANGINAGIESQFDSTRTVDELLVPIDSYRARVNASIVCLSQAYEIFIDGKLYDNVDLVFTRHPNKAERGFLAVIDISELAATKHEISVNKLGLIKSNPFGEPELDDFKMENLVRIAFWKM